ncbi:MAG: hypothetical protein AB1547_07010 [Thermodesulfobacteriota bacterium]
MTEKPKSRRPRNVQKHRRKAADFPFHTHSDTISILVELHLSDHQMHSVLRDLTRLSGPISVESGCDTCRIWLNYEEPRNILMSIGWRTEADLSRFIRSERFDALLAILETAAGRPRIYVSDRRRMQLHASGNPILPDAPLPKRTVS